MARKEAETKKALDVAKRLEEEQIASDKDIAEQYEKDMQKATAAAKLLKPAWFVRDVPVRRKRGGKGADK